jgi:cyclopropane fatty-acyl-phospholipid synthase-like methyltransferase
MDINAYGRQLLGAEIDAKEHRNFVGGLWKEVGTLQFNFLKSYGLQPSDRLVDVGCGALRGGVHFIRYLEPGHYYGIDINASLIEAGKRELEEEKLEHKMPHLLVNDKFELGQFATNFDCAIAISVLTHLPMNHIIRCLCEVGKVLGPTARLFASYFEAPTKAYLERLPHTPGDIVTNYDFDPYHYAFEEVRWMAGIAHMKVERVGAWGHPRGQTMLAFSSDS